MVTTRQSPGAAPDDLAQNEGKDQRHQDMVAAAAHLDDELRCHSVDMAKGGSLFMMIEPGATDWPANLENLEHTPEKRADVLTLCPAVMN